LSKTTQASSLGAGECQICNKIKVQPIQVIRGTVSSHAKQMPPKREPLKLATVGAVESDGSFVNQNSSALSFLNGIPIHL